MKHTLHLLSLTLSTAIYKAQQENSSYSFSYGVSDARTGDIKTVSESKEGNTVTGHYSVLEPDGSLRTVEYSAGPKTGFTALVKTDDAKNLNDKAGRSLFEEKSHKSYENFYDFSEDVDEESYVPIKRKRTKHPTYGTSRPEFSRKKKPKYPYDLEAADYTHSITIEHPSDDTYKSESHSHTNYEVDHKPKKYGNRNLYTNVVDIDYDKKNPFGLPFTNSKYTDEYESEIEAPSHDIEKLVSPYEDYYQTREYTDIYRQGLVNPKKQPPLFLPYPDIPEKFYDNEYVPPRPRKRHRPQNKPEYHPAIEEIDDFIMVPKKKYKITTKNAYADQYSPEDEDYDRPQYSSFNDEDELRPHRPLREPPTKEIIKKVVKKKKSPVLKLLDILDI